MTLYCLEHSLHYNSDLGGCFWCRELAKYKKEQEEGLLEQASPKHKKCRRCKRFLYHTAFNSQSFRYPDICHECLKDKNGQAKMYLDKIRIEGKIEKLINRAMAHKMSDLRKHLFETLEGVRDGSVETAKAKTVCEVAQVIINSAKVEIDYMKAMGLSGNKSSFIEIAEVIEQ